VQAGRRDGLVPGLATFSGVVSRSSGFWAFAARAGSRCPVPNRFGSSTGSLVAVRLVPAWPGPVPDDGFAPGGAPPGSPGLPCAVVT